MQPFVFFLSASVACNKRYPVFFPTMFFQIKTIQIFQIRSCIDSRLFPLDRINICCNLASFKQYIISLKIFIFSVT